MQFRHFICLCTISLLSSGILAEEGGAPPADPNTSATLGVVLHYASEKPESPYHLQVNCTDQKGIRSLTLFPGGATVWNQRSQIMLPASARTALLKTLVDRGFAGFEDSYGGREQPAKSGAPARITCRILVEIQGLQKSSLQMAGGEQSARLLSLAAELLDQAELYADPAVTPADLDDALDKLSEGVLDPHMLYLRFVFLPALKNKPGSILRLDGGQLSHQAYTPGKTIAAPTSESLGHDQYVELIAALQSAQLASLPVNLWSEDQVELEVRVLAHKKVLLARRFTRLESTNEEPMQQRFDALLPVLRELIH